MIKPARLTYTIGSLTFIFIGVLHSYAHLSDLSAAALLTALSDIGEVEVVGQTAQLTDLWHGISLLMGFSP